MGHAAAPQGTARSFPWSEPRAFPQQSPAGPPCSFRGPALHPDGMCGGMPPTLWPPALHFQPGLRLLHFQPLPAMPLPQAYFPQHPPPYPQLQPSQYWPGQPPGVCGYAAVGWHGQGYAAAGPQHPLEGYPAAAAWRAWQQTEGACAAPTGYGGGPYPAQAQELGRLSRSVQRGQGMKGGRDRGGSMGIQGDGGGDTCLRFPDLLH